MRKRPFIVSWLTLLCGMLAAVVLLIASDPVCNYLQEQRLSEHATSHTASIADRLQAKLSRLQDFTDEIAANTSLDEESFSKQAAKLIESVPGVYSVEWMPFVAPEHRSQVEADLRKRGVRTPLITTTRRARPPLEIPPHKAIRPSFFIHPLDDLTKDSVGYIRPSWPARPQAEKTGQPFISSKARYYNGDKQRKAIYVPVSHSKSAAGRKRSGAMFVMKYLFPNDELIGTNTTCRVGDVTPQHPWLDSDGQPNSDPKLIEQSHAAFVSRQRIGGRMFEFRQRESLNANLRPIWIPWLLFFVSNLVATLFAIQTYRKESQLLLARNQQLLNEIRRREAIERQLQGTLDFREQERELIAHDIHDGFVQDVIGAQMYAEGLAETEPSAKVISDVLANAIEEARQTIDFLKPRVVDEVGLVAAIEDSISEDQQRYSFETTLNTSPDFPRLPLFVERMLYRMIREAVCNARKHSGAREAMVSLCCDASSVAIEVTDEGNGFELEDVPTDCFGLAGIRHRAEVLCGTATIKSSDFGTKLLVELPRDFDLLQPPTNNIATSTGLKKSFNT